MSRDGRSPNRQGKPLVLGEVIVSEANLAALILDAEKRGFIAGFKAAQDMAAKSVEMEWAVRGQRHHALLTVADAIRALVPPGDE